jgi:hypothetical protein
MIFKVFTPNFSYSKLLQLTFGHDHKGWASRKLSGHYIFSFPKKGKEKDAISIPHAILFSKQ